MVFSYDKTIVLHYNNWILFLYDNLTIIELHYIINKEFGILLPYSNKIALLLKLHYDYIMWTLILIIITDLDSIMLM